MPISTAVHEPRIDSLLERLLALLLLIPATPLFIVLAPLVRLQDGGPFLYHGPRLGRDKQLFHIYKIRTLVPDAETRLDGELFHHQRDFQTPTGAFLRETRIDELPQLLNIIRGEMVFFGPRPERPSVYEAQCKHIVGYDQRFSRYPGLIGYAQLLTPHSTSKRLRARIDNIFYARHGQRFFRDAAMVLLVFCYLALRAVHRVVINACTGIKNIRRRHLAVERRWLERVHAKDVVVEVFERHTDARQPIAMARLADMNALYLRVRNDGALPDRPVHLRMTITRRTVFPRMKIKIKTAHCCATPTRNDEASASDPSHYTALRYETSSALQRYLLDKYFLERSIM